MNLTEIHHGINKRKRKKRVGRGTGSGRGKTSTRGHKGQWSSAGAKKPHKSFEGGQTQLFRKLPKRGFNRAAFARKFLIVNVEALDKAFNDGDTVDHATLKKMGLAKGPAFGVRILGNGELTKKLNVKAHHFTKSAKEKIEAKGGTTEIVPLPNKPAKNKMGSNKKKKDDEE